MQTQHGLQPARYGVPTYLQHASACGLSRSIYCKMFPVALAKAGAVRPQGRLVGSVQVRVIVGHSNATESNCVIARWGGEQLEVEEQPAG